MAALAQRSKLANWPPLTLKRLVCGKMHDPSTEGERPCPGAGSLAGKRIALVGRLAGMSRRQAAQLIRSRGASLAEKPDPSVDLIVLGEADWPLGQSGNLDQVLDGPTRQAVARGAVSLVGETELWQQLGLVEQEHDARRLYTPAMLAELVGVPVAVIRRWQRKGLLRPVRVVRRLAYFGFEEVTTARHLAGMLASGLSPQGIEKKLEALARQAGAPCPLGDLPVVIDGQEILLRRPDGLVDSGGQHRFDFDAPPAEAGFSAYGAEASLDVAVPGPETPAVVQRPATPQELCRMALELEDSGQLEAAAEMYRAALAAGGPDAGICFQLAELLYRLGDLAAARERYYQAVELDEDFVEARANLGCLLAETGQPDLAVAALEGALRFHPQYADAHYHLARTLDQLGRSQQACTHWQAFLELAPESPWADYARTRLAQQSPRQ